MDNLGSHKSAGLRSLIKAAGARLWYLPPYSPDLNPIEQTFAKIKHWMRSAQKRTVDDICRHIGGRHNHPARRMQQLLRKRRIRFYQTVKRSSQSDGPLPATGEVALADLQRREFWAMSASSKKCRAVMPSRKRAGPAKPCVRHRRER